MSDDNWPPYILFDNRLGWAEEDITRDPHLAKLFGQVRERFEYDPYWHAWVLKHTPHSRRMTPPWPIPKPGDDAK